MALSGTALAAALKPVIESELRSQYEIIEGFGDVEIEKFCSALSDAIGTTVVSYIVANAQVVVTSVTGVQTGGGTSGPGTGTIT